MIHAVIDTNILVSALLRLDSIPAFVVEQALTGNIIPVLHDDILYEYGEVLSRNKFTFDPDLVSAVINGMISGGIFIEAADVNISLPDPKDIIFYATALSARKHIDSNTYIITGNTKYFPQVSFAATPREALNLLLHGG